MQYMLFHCVDESIEFSSEYVAEIEASRHPVARIGTVEVRPLQQDGQRPSSGVG